MSSNPDIILAFCFIILITSSKGCLLPKCDSYFAEHKEQFPPLSALTRGHKHCSVHYSVPNANPHDDSIVLIL